jgi:hypothetical protein
MKKIPKIIHFVWVGNEPLPDKYAENIRTWASQNPNFNIILWVDKKGSPPEVAQAYKEGSIGLPRTSKRFQIKDISEQGISDDFIRYEIDKLRPNYGAASDLIRYKALYEHGGVYLDTELQPGDRPLSQATEVFKTKHKTSVTFLNSYTKGSTANDTFITSKKNPFFQLLSELAQARYRIGDRTMSSEADIEKIISMRDGSIVLGNAFERSNISLLPNQTYSADQSEYIEEITLFRTGPRLLRYALCNFMKIPNVEIYELKAGDLRCPIDKDSSDASWTGRSVQPQDISDPAKLDHVIEQSLQIIQFEVETNGILHLDDHIAWLCDALKLDQVDISRMLIEKLSARQDILAKIQGAQLNFQHAAVYAFYEENGLLPKTFLFPSIEEVSSEYSEPEKEEYSSYYSPIARCQLAIESATSKIQLMKSLYVSQTETLDQTTINTTFMRGVVFLSGLLEKYRTHKELDPEIRQLYKNEVLPIIAKIINEVYAKIPVELLSTENHSKLTEVKQKYEELIAISQRETQQQSHHNGTVISVADSPPPGDTVPSTTSKPKIQ